MTKLIALTGPAGSGKSTLAKLLIQRNRFVCVSFAAPIKAMLDALLRYEGVPDDRRNEMLFGSQKELPTALLGGKSPRFAMQTLGTEWRDLLDTNLWVNAWGEKIREFDRVVVDDLRFPHEAERVHLLGGKIVHVQRAGFVANTVHPSESQFADLPVDLVVANSKDHEPEWMWHQINLLGEAF